MSLNSNKFINGFQDKEISKIMILYHSFLELIFPVYHIMLKHYFYSYYKELFFLILEYFILLMFLFSKPVSNKQFY